MRNYITFEPVRSLNRLLALGSAIIALVAILADVPEEVVGAIGLVWSMFILFLGSFVRSNVTPEAAGAGD